MTYYDKWLDKNNPYYLLHSIEAKTAGVVSCAISKQQY